MRVRQLPGLGPRLLVASVAQVNLGEPHLVGGGGEGEGEGEGEVEGEVEVEVEGQREG